ncbi:hypothetical protein ACFQ0B_18400 [Nonomuraea thailandensis]
MRAYTRGAELKVVAELETRRSVTVLKDGETGLVEIADDRVKGTVYGDEPRILRWREVEAELLEGGTPQLLAKVGKRLRKAGANASEATSKLAKLLEPAPSPRPPRNRAAPVRSSSATWRARSRPCSPRTRACAGPRRTPSTRCAWPPGGCAARSRRSRPS